MPVAHFHLPTGTATPEQQRTLLLDASATYSRILDSPIERVRAFVVEYAPSQVAVAGQLVSEGGAVAPYFTAIVLAGRPVAQRQTLLAAFTDLIVATLGVDKSFVRGQIIEVAPENWGIAGSAASAVRADEVAQRAAVEG